MGEQGQNGDGMKNMELKRRREKGRVILVLKGKGCSQYGLKSKC